MSKARQEIFMKLKKASGKSLLPGKPDFDLPLFPPLEDSLANSFKNAIGQINGQATIFESEEVLYKTLKQKIKDNNWKHLFCFEPDIQQELQQFDIQFASGKPIAENIEVGITGCEFLIARTGSVMVSSKQAGARQMFAYPPVHFIIAKESQLVDSLETAYKKIYEKYSGNLPSMISLISGPSRTADIEKTLVLGAHGPKELHIFISK